MTNNITIIKPTKGWKLIDIEELLRYKDLFYFLVLRSIKAKYAQSILGIGWAIVQPLFTMVLFTVIFGKLAKIDSDGIPYVIFSLSGIIPWMYFSGSVNESSNSLVMNSAMISKVYFPRIILPISATFSKLLDFLIGFVILICFLLYFKIYPTINILLVPFLVILLIFTASGIGMLLSSLAVKYRDVKHALTFLLQLVMYTTPVIYPSSKIPESFRYIYALNPMVGIIDGFRASVLNKPIPFEFIAMSICISSIIFIFGAFYFKKMERIFADVV